MELLIPYLLIPLSFNLIGYIIYTIGNIIALWIFCCFNKAPLGELLDVIMTTVLLSNFNLVN